MFAACLLLYICALRRTEGHMCGQGKAIVLCFIVVICNLYTYIQVEIKLVLLCKFQEIIFYKQITISNTILT